VAYFAEPGGGRPVFLRGDDRPTGDHLARHVLRELRPDGEQRLRE
jgi:hypothetical protein